MTKVSSENYVNQVVRTESENFIPILDRLCDIKIARLLHASIGMGTETGEFQDVIKKYIFYGKPLDVVNLAEEIGDIFWYLGIAMDVLDVPMNEVLTMNINKLKARYPDKFKDELALNRDLETERQILENPKRMTEF